MCWPPIGWSFVRGKIQIAMVVGRVCRVVVGEGTLKLVQLEHIALAVSKQTNTVIFLWLFTATCYVYSLRVLHNT